VKCSICSSAMVNQVDELLGGGSSIRQVSRMTPFSRSALARHKAHARPLEARFGVIDGEAGSSGTLDPLGEAISLFRRASTTRERLRAAQGIRSATDLALRAAKGSVDAELLERLDANVVVAAEIYRSLDGFDSELAALAGHREAIAQRLKATQAAPGDYVEVVGNPKFYFTNLDGSTGPEMPDYDPDRPARSYRVPAERYWAGVPHRFRDLQRYRLERLVKLSFEHQNAGQDVKVYDWETGVLVWRDHTDPH
jgi:hypothetical protein